MYLLVMGCSASIWDIWFDSQYYNPVNLLQGIGGIATAGALFYAFKQNLSGKVQQFESTFFKLIDLHNNIISYLNYRSIKHNPITEEIDSDITYKGKQVFHSARLELTRALNKEEIRSYITKETFTNSYEKIENIEQAKRVFKNQYYSKYYSHFETELNHYFRNLFHIIKYLDQSSLINTTQKKFYASIIRAQLSQDELYVWMFNSMQINYGYPKVLYLITKYDMMQNFRFEMIKPQIWWQYFEYLKDTARKPKGWQ